MPDEPTGRRQDDGAVPTAASPPAPAPASRPASPSDRQTSPSGGTPQPGSAPAGVPSDAAPPPVPPRPRIGDTRPAPPAPRSAAGPGGSGTRAGQPPATGGTTSRPRRRRGGRGRGGGHGGTTAQKTATPPKHGAAERTEGAAGSDGTGPLDVGAAVAPAGVSAAAAGAAAPDLVSQALTEAGHRSPASASAEAPEASDGGATSRRRAGRERRNRAVGRYMMCVHVRPHATQIAVLEGRTLVQHLVSRAADDSTQIDGNIYRGRVQNVLPGMEAAFVDIGTPKNAVLYRGDVRYDRDDVEAGSSNQLRIEEMLVPGQLIVCQVTKNPIGAKGARLTQEVSIPGRFAVMVPNSSAFGISKRLDDNERRRLRKIVDDVRPEGHGLIVRTAAEGASREELAADVARLVERWRAIEAAAGSAKTPGLLYREPDMAVRIVREELNRDYRAVLVDDPALYEEVRAYVEQVNPELADRVELYDPEEERLPLFERYHVHEQLHKALDRKVWLPSGGSIIIERTEALTVIDVNTGKNIGTSNLEETVFRNNLEAAEEIARQLRLRDIGGIIVIDFIDMEIRENRDKVAAALREALARDKTRTQVFDISELGLVEMTRKRVSEGLVESLSSVCSVCGGRGIVLDATLV